MTDAELNELAREALDASRNIVLRAGATAKNVNALKASRLPVRKILEATRPKAPPPPTEQPTAEKPFLDMAHVRDWHGTNANPGDITDVADGIQLRVPNDHEAGSMSGNPRAELLTAPLFTEGDEVWLRTRIWLSPGVPSGWMTLCSFFNAGGSIAPWHLSCVGGKFGWQAPAGNMVWSEPVTTGKWIDVLHHHRFGTGVQLESWIKVEGKDGDWRQVWGTANGKSNTWTSGNNNAPNYFKDCVYYQKEGTSSGVYTAKFGRTLLGPTRGSVVGVEGGSTAPPPPVVQPPAPPPPSAGAFKPDIFLGDALSKYSTVQPRDGSITMPTPQLIVMKPSNSTGVAISGNPRDEVISPKFWGANAHVCVGFAVRFPDSAKAALQKFSGDSTFAAFFQFFGTPWDGSPPLKCELFDHGSRIGWQHNVSGGWKRAWDAPIRYGDWMTFVYDIHLGARVGDPAPVITYLDGVKVNEKSWAVFDAGSRDGKLCSRLMLYRKKDVYDGVIPIEFKPLAEGTRPELVDYG